MNRSSLRVHTSSFFCAVAVFCVASQVGSAEDADTIDFNREIRPILSNHCFRCHGPDAAQRKKKLRLDTLDGVAERGIIVPNEPADSILVQRIFSSDPEFRMPPPDAHLDLSEAQRESLRQWIAEGAQYRPHWAFETVGDPSVPKPRGARRWVRTPIDAYILEALVGEGLEPAPRAGKEAMIRRLSFDLRGLPPTLEEIDRFLFDSSAAAYEKVVDAFLESPAYGEHMAAPWLDVARYADTYGYQNDKESVVWPWREWVIGAFNDNMPYDDFILLQLAGDLLPSPTQEDYLATAFNRLHRQTNEGGSINEEFRVEYVADRTQTFATAFMGLTLECARCHDHKFDPISQKEYYQLFSFFNNIDESGLYSHFTNAIPSPSVLLYDEGQASKHAALKVAIVERESEVSEAARGAALRFEEWRALLNESLRLPEPVIHLPLDEVSEEETANLGSATTVVKVPMTPKSVSGAVGDGLLFDGENGVTCEHAAAFDRSDPFSISLWLRVGSRSAHTVVMHRMIAEIDAGSRGYELLLEEGRPTFSLIHFWPGNAIRVRAHEAVPEEKWTHIAVTYDGSSRAAGLKIFRDGVEQGVDVIRDNLFKTIRYTKDGSGANLTLAFRMRDSGFKDGSIDEFKVFDRRLAALEVRALAGKRTLVDPLRASEEGELLEYYMAAIDENYVGVFENLTEARRAESDYVDTIREIMAMREMEVPREAHVLTRGAYDQPAEPVSAATPAVLPPMDEALPRNRLGLARWLVDPSHPLTSRVAVNRLWQNFFSRGLVLTQEDFGNQGAVPSHKDLLDFLARRFMDSGWDVKGMNKLIVMSAVYQQDSTRRPELAARDPENTRLARGASYRLSAEEIRDHALAASGLLVRTIGGPSVRPYQPPGLWREAGQVTYKADEGDGLYRRSLYTYWKRTVPPPSMLNFDATTREVCRPRRETTTTPLQSLVLLNDVQFVEAARVLAEGALIETGGKDSEISEYIFRRLTGRRPSRKERRILLRTLAEQYEHFAQRSEEAEAYVSVGDAPRREGDDLMRLAAATALAQAVMNLDEFQMQY